MNRALTGKTALVTGASSGIGAAISMALAAEGCGLYLVGRDQERLDSVANRVSERATEIQTFKVDLRSETDVAKMADSMRKKPAGLDILIHAAGTISLGRIETAGLAEFDAQYQCNARAPYQLTQALLPVLKARKGQVVFINSTAGLNGRGTAGAYAASKHALKAIADSLREEVNADGVRVTSIFLGRTATPMQEKLFSVEGKNYRSHLLLQPADVAATIVQLLRLPPTAEVTDLTMRPGIKSY